MSQRFIKKVFNAEDGTRMLGFIKPGTPDGERDAYYVTFNLNVLEDQRLSTSDMDFAVHFVRVLEEMMGFRLTPEEIEYAVEDI